MSVVASLVAAAAVAFSGPATFVPQTQVQRASTIDMNTKYTVAAGVAKKKKAGTGTATSLKGYKVGMRAPDIAKSSGTTQGEQSLWDKVFGGKK
mmetsp:Transcript_59938/g.133570  ORF Transcript_59938/g.133570 Transcript_59938/m.133570 type:complete len:94 (-) Transcript_59938:550-831(-)|eukprot:CAMPEP_0181193558 /NCGR_PEP_ID=MMETSP1096-20121128/13882_1 /TAXON_ID=156174 ORGANISM="Chrysochromulina ericina, Strain CCMP281" /NCGR_SAMPLE_ID=MMETSP1096 /ASSEMBLY_ACC=CAM_ASM_000453 /LENGTH=93 /DNA_ID=CAMNT_0023283031 /DNA_START=30 /DNA_END=311 /DNA_ORIENTATION=+